MAVVARNLWPKRMELDRKMLEKVNFCHNFECTSSKNRIKKCVGSKR